MYQAYIIMIYAIYILVYIIIVYKSSTGDVRILYIAYKKNRVYFIHLFIGKDEGLLLD